jgi:hypothetical protein
LLKRGQIELDAVVLASTPTYVLMNRDETMHAAERSAEFIEDMPWDLSVYAGNLEVDLRPGIRGKEWEPLLNGILKQATSVELVTFLVPKGFELGDQAQFLNSIEQAITSRGIDVVRVPVS